MQLNEFRKFIGLKRPWLSFFHNESSQDADCLGSIWEICGLEPRTRDPCRIILPYYHSCLILSALQKAAETLYKDIDNLELYVSSNSLFDVAGLYDRSRLAYKPSLRNSLALEQGYALVILFPGQF